MIVYLMGVVVSLGLFILMFTKDTEWREDADENLTVYSLMIATFIVSSWFFVLTYTIYLVLDYYKER